MITEPAANLEELRGEDLVGALTQIQILLELVLIRLPQLLDALIELLSLLAQVAEALLVGLRKVLVDALQLTLGECGRDRLRENLPGIAFRCAARGAGAALF